MDIRNNFMEMDESTLSAPAKRSNKKFTHSLEYEIIANLVLQQYEKEGLIQYDLLFSIEPADRVQALTIEYGKKRMYRLVATLLREFCISIPLPKSKKLNDTRINVCACDLMISAEEEALSIEDLILFFERTKKGTYGPVKKYLTHQIIREKLDTYLAERNEALYKFSKQKTIAIKKLGIAERNCEEPKQIGEILKGAAVIEMNKRMSG